MKKIYLYIMLILGLPAYSHTFSVYYTNIGQVYFGGMCAYETQAKDYAIAYICNDYIKRYYPDFKYKVIISAYHEGTVDNTLGLDTIGFNDYNIPYQETILRINISSKSSLTLNSLKLLDYSITHINLLEQAKVDFYSIKNTQKSLYPSITQKQIDSIINALPKKRISRSSMKKVKRILQCQTEYNPELYYIKEDTLNFYAKGFLRKKILLKLPEVKQVLGNSEVGYLIFIKNNKFYFLNENKLKLVGPIIIEDYIEGTPFYFKEIDSLNKSIVFFYLTYDSVIEKIQLVYNFESNILEQHKIEKQQPELPEWYLKLHESLETIKERENIEERSN